MHLGFPFVTAPPRMSANLFIHLVVEIYKLPLQFENLRLKTVIFFSPVSKRAFINCHYRPSLRPDNREGLRKVQFGGTSSVRLRWPSFVQVSIKKKTLFFCLSVTFSFHEFPYADSNNRAGVDNGMLSGEWAPSAPVVRFKK